MKAIYDFEESTRLAGAIRTDGEEYHLSFHLFVFPGIGTRVRWII